MPKNSAMPATLPPVVVKRRRRGFHRAVLRGLGIMLPPVLTIVILLWIYGTVQVYVLHPVKEGARQAITWWIADIHNQLPGVDVNTDSVEYDGRQYIRLPDQGQFVPAHVYQRVAFDPSTECMPTTGRALYRQYVDLVYLQDRIVIPVFLCVFVLVLYLLGKFLAARAANLVGWLLHRVPLVRSVYGSVKQVTDFMFKQAEVRYTKIVAVQYPRKGIWGVGLVTGEGILQVNDAVAEPCLTVVLPGTPMPVTGYAITVPTSETIELDITLEQALQFYISGGVVIPPHQRCTGTSGDGAAATAGHQPTTSGK